MLFERLVLIFGKPNADHAGPAFQDCHEGNRDIWRIELAMFACENKQPVKAGIL